MTLSIRRSSAREQFPQGGKDPAGRPSDEVLAMSYYDRKPANPNHPDPDQRDNTYRPAMLRFENDESHRAAASIFGAMTGPDNLIYKQMLTQIDNPDREDIDPMSLPTGITPDFVRNPNYDSRLYGTQPAREIREKIGMAATYFLQPEGRPEGLTDEMIHQAAALDSTALTLNELPFPTMSTTRVLPDGDKGAALPVPSTGSTNDTFVG